jgi:hypothetical protein
MPVHTGSAVIRVLGVFTVDSIATVMPVHTGSAVIRVLGVFTVNGVTSVVPVSGNNILPKFQNRDVADRTLLHFRQRRDFLRIRQTAAGLLFWRKNRHFLNGGF